MKFLKQSSWMFKEIWLIPHPPPCMLKQEGGRRAFPKHDPVGTKCVSSGRHWRLRWREANKDDQATRRCWRPRIEMLEKEVHARPNGKPQAYQGERRYAWSWRDFIAVGQEKNREEWKKGVMFLHKAHNIEQPLQLVCPLEIGVAETIVQPHESRREINLRSQRPTPNVAQRAAHRIVQQLQAEHMWAKSDKPTRQKWSVSSKSCLEFLFTYESS